MDHLIVEMANLRKALTHLGELQDLASSGLHREWGVDLDALEETRFVLLARLGAVVLDMEREEKREPT